MKDAVVDGESAISEDEPQVQKQDIHAKVYMVRKIQTPIYIWVRLMRHIMQCSVISNL